MEIIPQTKEIENDKVVLIKQSIIFRKYRIVAFEVGKDHHITINSFDIQKQHHLINIMLSNEYGFIIMQIKRVYPEIFANNDYSIKSEIIRFSIRRQNKTRERFNLVLIIKKNKF